MAVGSWNAKDLEALEKAIAQGVRSVKYTDKEIEYRSLDDMLRLRDVIKRDLGLTRKSNRLYAKFSKGTC